MTISAVRAEVKIARKDGMITTTEAQDIISAAGRNVTPGTEGKAFQTLRLQIESGKIAGGDAVVPMLKSAEQRETPGVFAPLKTAMHYCAFPYLFTRAAIQGLVELRPP